MAEVTWLTAFLDHAPEDFAGGVRFWAAATGTSPSVPRGADGEFATLEPPDGDAHLLVQRLREGPSRIHLDVHAADDAALVEAGTGLGAAVLRRGDGWTVLRSPGGFVFCVVPHPARVRSGPRDWGDHVSLLDQVCLDVPADVLEPEATFWSRLLGQALVPSPNHPEFTDLDRPDHLPLGLMVQRVAPGGTVSAHPDLAGDDRVAEVQRLVGLGARVQGVFRHWTVLVAPDGRRFCVTDRRPGER